MASIFTTPLYARTSKVIYDHGEAVQITIDGVTVGGKVMLTVADDPFNAGDNGIADTYKAVTITDGGRGDLDHLKNGVIVTTWKAPANLQAANATLNVKATDLGVDGRAGTADDRIAKTSFEDKAPATAKLTVVSDKADYAPGETALLTVDNVKVGGKVTFNIADNPSDPGSDGIANTYQKFTIVDGGKGDLDGLKNGSITAKWLVPANGSALDATLDVRVVDHGNDGRAGTADDRAATTSFTDAGGGESVGVNRAVGDDHGEVGQWPS